ncbi:hypothetical protein ACFVW1_43260, partial [Streptomyces olivochromogenes]
RTYAVDTADGGVGFIVHDMPGDQHSLDEILQGFLDAYKLVSPGDTLTATSIQKTTVDGRPALDARLSSSDGSVGAVRIIADDTHVVQAVTFGPKANEKALNQMHQQLITSIHIP